MSKPGKSTIVLIADDDPDDRLLIQEAFEEIHSTLVDANDSQPAIPRGKHTMNKPSKTLSILMADDDPDDRFLTQEAFEENHLINDLHFVEDGEKLMDYLHQRGEFSDPAQSPRPGLILLDLNMPRKDGRQALKEIKADPDLRSIPIVVLTTSKAEEDILRTYDLGVNSFITKPVTFEGLVSVVKTLSKYWFEIVSLPLSLF
jgi:CheY-like chemotaxis protein